MGLAINHEPIQLIHVSVRSRGHRMSAYEVEANGPRTCCDHLPTFNVRSRYMSSELPNHLSPCCGAWIRHREHSWTRGFVAWRVITKFGTHADI